MDTKKNREKIIKDFLGLEELSPMEAGVIRGGDGKLIKMDREFKKTQDEDIE